MHPDLLSQAQKLKLYALYRQSLGQAPEQPPDDASELQQAKWEAWRDVRSLTKLEAMASYSEIMEGLSTMMQALENEGVSPPHPHGSDGPYHRPPGTGVAAGANGHGGVPQEQEEESASEDGSGEASEDEASEAEEAPPVVTETVWQTAAVMVNAGDAVEFPIALQVPSRCTYSFSVVSGTGPIGFRLRGPAKAEPLISEYESTAEGELDVATPAAGGVLLAILDNTGSMLTPVEVRCHVCLQPLEELAAKSAYEGRRALRAMVARKEADLHAHNKKTAAVGRDIEALKATLIRLREQTVVAEGELRLKYKMLEQVCEFALLCSHTTRLLADCDVLCFDVPACPHAQGAEMSQLLEDELNEIRSQMRRA